MGIRNQTQSTPKNAPPKRPGQTAENSRGVLPERSKCPSFPLSCCRPKYCGVPKREVHIPNLLEPSPRSCRPRDIAPLSAKSSCDKEVCTFPKLHGSLLKNIRGRYRHY